MTATTQTFQIVLAAARSHGGFGKPVAVVTVAAESFGAAQKRVQANLPRVPGAAAGSSSRMFMGKRVGGFGATGDYTEKQLLQAERFRMA